MPNIQHEMDSSFPDPTLCFSAPLGGGWYEKGEIVEIKDTARLRRYLSTDPARYAYQLGVLDPLFAPYARWFAEEDSEGEIQSLVLLYSGLRLPVLMASGSFSGLDRLLSKIEEKLPSEFQFRVEKHHLDALERYFNVREHQPMIRMVLRREDFTKQKGCTCEVQKIGHRDTGALMKLYQFYPDHFFEPFQLESELYFGVREGDELVSVAGVHVVSEADNIASIGNLVTHPDHRGKGLATCSTSTMLTHLFKRVGLTTLDTRQENKPAYRTFHRLGFRPHSIFQEGIAAPR